MTWRILLGTGLHNDESRQVQDPHQQAGELGQPTVQILSKGQQAQDPGRAHVAVRV